MIAAYSLKRGVFLYGAHPACYWGSASEHGLEGESLLEQPSGPLHATALTK